MDTQYGGLLVIAAAAVAAALLGRLISRRFLPPVVVEVLLGVLIGPQGLGLVRATGAVEVLYVLGFGFLLFLAGQEVEPRRFRGPSFRLAGLNFIVCSRWPRWRRPDSGCSRRALTSGCSRWP